MARPNNFKPTHRLTGQHTRAFLGQLDNILVTQELPLENNEDKVEKKNMETIMKDIQVQPWWQYEDITMLSESAVKEAMNKVLLSQGALVTTEQTLLLGDRQSKPYTASLQLNNFNK
eukprot:3746542-Amphidinium_carterae.1